MIVGPGFLVYRNGPTATHTARAVIHRGGVAAPGKAGLADHAHVIRGDARSHIADADSARERHRG